MEKSSTGGVAVTTRPTVVLWVAVVPVPVIVRVKLPDGVDAPAVTLSVELPPAVTDTGLNVPVAPVGRPVTERLTV